MRNTLRLAVPACALLLGGCPPDTPRPYPNLVNIIGSSWTVVPLPNAGLQPGTIVQVVQASAGTPAAGAPLDLRELGNLAQCGVPATAIQVAANAVPGVTSGRTYSFDASLGAKMAGVSAQVAGNAGSNANLTIGTASDSTLNYIAFEQWTMNAQNAQQMASLCGPILSQAGIYVVQEAFVISAGSYGFTTSAGASISVTPPPSIPVTASAGVKVGSDGGVTITQPIVFALKVLAPLPTGGFQVASIGASAPHMSRHPAVAMAPPPAAAMAPPPPAVAAPLLLEGHAIASLEVTR